MKKQVVFMEHCVPDFFPGYHRPVVQIVGNKPMTNKEVAEAILDEVNYSYDYLTDANNGYSEEEIRLFDDYAEGLMQTPGELFINVDIDEDAEHDEFCEVPYLYFVIAEPVFVHGIWFMNP